MAAKFSFDLDDYKKTFIGLIVESAVKENLTAPPEQRNQYWSLGIVHLERSEDGSDWKPQGGKCMFELNPDSTTICPFVEANLAQYRHTFHNHYRVWSGETPTSPAARLLTSFKENVSYIVTAPGDVLNKTYKWQEVVTPPYKKKDGTLSNNGRPYYNYIVIGSLTPDGMEEAPSAMPENEDLPWDPPAAAATPNTTPASPANGAVTELSAEDIDYAVAGLLDGKTIDEGKAIIRATPELFGNPQFRLLFLQNKHTESAEKRGILTLDTASGRYKAIA